MFSVSDCQNDLVSQDRKCMYCFVQENPWIHMACYSHRCLCVCVFPSFSENELLLSFFLKGKLWFFISEMWFIWNVLVQMFVTVYTCNEGLKNSVSIYINLLWIYVMDKIYKSYFHTDFLVSPLYNVNNNHLNQYFFPKFEFSMLDAYLGHIIP